MNLDDFFVVVCTDFHESLVSTRKMVPARVSVQNLGKRRADPAQLAPWFSLFPLAVHQRRSAVVLCFAPKQSPRAGVPKKKKKRGGRTQTEPDPVIPTKSELEFVLGIQ